MREPCYKCKFEHRPIEREPCEYCSDEYIKSGDHPSFQWAKSPTNYVRLHTMNIEELARELCYVETGVTTYSEQIYLHWLDWLKQEATDGKDN